jgi:sec-independent protein translocase protein TatC
MAKTPHDDLFEKSSMTFGEHLEELRVCLFRSVVGIAVGCLIGFVIANSVVRFFQSPLERAMENYYLATALADFPQLWGEPTYEVKQMILNEKLIPEATQIDAGKLAEALQITYPEQFGGIEISPYWYTLGDFLEDGPREFCRLLVRGKDETDTARGRCWQLLSEDERQAAQALNSELSSATGPLTKEQQTAVLRVLNSLGGNRELHQSPEFAALTGSDAGLAQTFAARVLQLFGKEPPKTTDTVGQLRTQLAEKFDAQQSRRLNKLLLARVFPSALRTARVNVLPVFAWRPVKIKFQSLSAEEPFMIWMKAGFITGLVIASPYVFYQIWIFVAAGLYPREKNYVFLYLPISIGLFFGGASLAFAFVFDPVLNFLFTFNKGMNAEFEPRIGEWLSFVLILPLGFGISFQLPLVMLFLNRIGVASLDLLVQQWRVAILIICVVSMVLTPADPISMMLMAVPLCLLYLVGLLMCRFMPRGRNPFDEAYEP